MRFLHTMIRYDLGNAFGDLAIRVEDIALVRGRGQGSQDRA